MALVQRKDIFKDYSAHLVQVDREQNFYVAGVKIGRLQPSAIEGSEERYILILRVRGTALLGSTIKVPIRSGRDIKHFIDNYLDIDEKKHMVTFQLCLGGQVHGE
jgi:hypothetical protein